MRLETGRSCFNEDFVEDDDEEDEADRSLVSFERTPMLSAAEEEEEVDWPSFAAAGEFALLLKLDLGELSSELGVSISSWLSTSENNNFSISFYISESAKVAYLLACLMVCL